MKVLPKIAVLIVLLGFLGLSLFIFLLVRHGVADIGAAFAEAGWYLALVILSHFLTVFFDALSWRALIPREFRPALWRLVLIHWIGDSISELLPVAQVGGEVVRVRLLSGHPVGRGPKPAPVPVATSSVLVGMTISLATQILFTLSGLALLVFLTGHDGLSLPIIVAAVIAVGCVAGFYAVQRVGIFRIITRLIARIASGDAWSGLIRRGEQLDQDVLACYSRRAAMAESAFWTFCTWGAGAVEVWIALWAMGFRASFTDAYTLESLNQGIRSAVFLVPGALGFQEGGYIVVGRLLGIPSQGALALSLVRRVRDLAWGIPGLLTWQILEGHRLWLRRSLTAPSVKAP